MQYYLVEQKALGAEYVRHYNGRPVCFDTEEEAEIMADGLRHMGRAIEVVEIDPRFETPLA